VPLSRAISGSNGFVKTLTVAVGITVGLSMSACSSSTHPARRASPPTSTSTSQVEATPTSAAAASALHPMVTVAPSTGLHDGQAVTITVSGFVPGGKAFLSECATAASVNKAGCGDQLGGQPFAVTDDQGSGTTSFNVAVMASSRPYDMTGVSRCQTSCVLVATAGMGGEAIASAPLTFV
jgi:hypothetical protein